MAATGPIQAAAGPGSPSRFILHRILDCQISPAAAWGPKAAAMSDLLHLLRLALGELAHGRLPHNDILKPLISKVGGAERR